MLDNEWRTYANDARDDQHRDRHDRQAIASDEGQGITPKRARIAPVLVVCQLGDISLHGMASYSRRMRGSRTTYITSESSTPTMNMTEATTTEPITKRIVTRENRVDDQLAHAGPLKDLLDDDRARQQSADGRTEKCRYRQQSILQGVTQPDDSGLQALGVGGAHVVLLQNFQHLRPGKARDEGDRVQREHGYRQNHVSPAHRPG